MKSFLLVCVVALIVALTACGGGGTGTTTPPPPQTYTISASVTGLSGTLVMQDDKGDTLTFTTDMTQSFASQYSSGATYAVSVKSNPNGQTCSVGSNATGSATSNVTVAVTCANSSNSYTIGVSVSGLSSGTSLVLQNNGSDNLTITANGAFTFSGNVQSGAAYAVTVFTQPTGETCSLGNNSSGTATSNVTINVTCSAGSTSYSISVSVSGLTSGTLVLQDDAGQQLSFTSSTTQTFSNTYVSGAQYAVRLVTQPTGETCATSGATSGNITSNITISVSCTPVTSTFTLSASVSGLTTGTLIVQDNLGDQLQFNSDGTQLFGQSYTGGESYTVTIASQPIGETCAPTSTTGTITANTTVAFTCTLGTYTISANVTGLTSGQTLVLQDSQSDSLTFSSNTNQTFAKSYTSGATYSVSVLTQPSGETCTLSGNSSGTITSNITVTATCSAVTYTISATVTGLASGTTLVLQDDKNDQLSFTTNNTQQFGSAYASGSTYTVTVATQPAGQTCTLSNNATGTITSNTTVTATCAASTSHPLGSVSNVSAITPCSGKVANGTCEQMTVSCPNVPDIQAYIKINTPATPIGTVLYAVGTDGNGLYDSIYTYGSTAVQNVLNAGFRTVQISFGTPFNNNQPGGWVQGPGGVLAGACRYATIAQYVYSTVQNDNTKPMCATANSGGAGALAYALSQYGSGDIISMAEVTSGPPTGRLDWGCGCKQGSMPVPTSCFPSGSMGTCFGTTDAGVWDPAYTPNAYCSNAVKGTLPPGGLTFFLDDSAEAPGAQYNLPTTKVNILFGGQDTSSAIPIGWDWFNNITSTKTNGCVADAPHSIPNVLDGAQQIATDIINMCTK